ncbi:hypothetical protein FRX31_028846 [Thalictrum thalictroides]|uniref:Uncharacterized protein n=1 Tax=Thalictrum thalictroides TaxID=46969 RepID=A0A7J6VA72_THATH|nr:hypothetical protein FRX31_028846 [Thalictrum thalictroides]
MALSCSYRRNYLHSIILLDFPVVIQSDHRSYHLPPNSQPGAVKLQDNLESQLSKVSTQSDFLGRDSSGRLYWILGGSGAGLQLVVDCSMPVQLGRTRVTACSDSVAGTLYMREKME